MIIKLSYVTSLFKLKIPDPSESTTCILILLECKLKSDKERKCPPSVLMKLRTFVKQAKIRDMYFFLSAETRV